MIYTTSKKDEKQPKPGYLHNPPKVLLLADGNGTFIAVSGKAVALQDRLLVPMDSIRQEPQEEGTQKQGLGTDVYRLPYNEEPTGRDGLMSNYNDGVEV